MKYVGFLNCGVPLFHPFLVGIFHSKPTILGNFHWNGNPHVIGISASNKIRFHHGWIFWLSTREYDDIVSIRFTLVAGAIHWPYGCFHSHGGTPSHHPFLVGIFHEINDPAMWVPPWLWNPPIFCWWVHVLMFVGYSPVSSTMPKSSLQKNGRTSQLETSIFLGIFPAMVDDVDDTRGKFITRYFTFLSYHSMILPT